MTRSEHGRTAPHAALSGEGLVTVRSIRRPAACSRATGSICYADAER